MSIPLSPSVLAELAQAKPTPDASILSHFHGVPDFRREHGRRHLLIDILVIAVCATLADCDSFVEMAEYGQDNEAWLRTFLELPEGVPSHDTFRRVLLLLAPAPFQRACVSWLQAATAKLRRQQQAATAAPTDSPTDGPADGPAAPPTARVASAAAGPPSRAAAPEADPAPPGHAPDPRGHDLAPAPPGPGAGREALQPPQPTASPPALEAARPQQQARAAGHQLPPAPPGPAPAAAAPVPPQGAVGQPVATPVAGTDGQRRHLAVDGKTARGSCDQAAGRGALHSVSVWASAERLTLAQVAVQAKSNEITAIPEVLALVGLAGAVVSIDAIGTQEAIVAQVRDGGGDYLLAVKENQPHLYEDVLASFVRHFERLDGRPDAHELVTLSNGAHGRQEKRTYVVLSDVSGIRDPEKWRDVRRLIMVHRECEKGDGTSEEDSRYFIGSAASGAEAYAKWVRDHWGIENSLHWVLDVVFHEDDSRARKGHGAENLAMLRRLAVSLLGNDKACKRSIKGKRKKAARSNDYLAHVLLDLAGPVTPLETQGTAPPA